MVIAIDHTSDLNVGRLPSAETSIACHRREAVVREIDVTDWLVSVAISLMTAATEKSVTTVSPCADQKTAENKGVGDLTSSVISKLLCQKLVR